MQSTDYLKWKMNICQMFSWFSAGQFEGRIDWSVKSQDRNLIGKIQLVATAKEHWILCVYPLWQGLIARVDLWIEIKAELCVSWPNICTQYSCTRITCKNLHALKARLNTWQCLHSWMRLTEVKRHTDWQEQRESERVLCVCAWGGGGAPERSPRDIL